MGSQIPAFRLLEALPDGEVDRVLGVDVRCHFGKAIDSMKALMERGAYSFYRPVGSPITW